MNNSSKFPELDSHLTLVEIADIKGILQKVINGDPENLLPYYKKEAQASLDRINSYISAFDSAVKSVRESIKA